MVSPGKPSLRKICSPACAGERSHLSDERAVCDADRDTWGMFVHRKSLNVCTEFSRNG